jgi:hypothetical protein
MGRPRNTQMALGFDVDGEEIQLPEPNRRRCRELLSQLFRDVAKAETHTRRSCREREDSTHTS